MVREGELLETAILSELGIFGAFLQRGDKVLMNNEAAHLSKTKVTTDTICHNTQMYSTMYFIAVAKCIGHQAWTNSSALLCVMTRMSMNPRLLSVMWWRLTAAMNA